MSRERIFIIDGNSLIYRAFYAISEMQNSSGQPTNAIYGFNSMLKAIIRGHDPEYLVVALDSKKQCFRHQLYPEYKANRAKTPVELLAQFDGIRQLLAARHIPVLLEDGYEADDLIATLAQYFADQVDVVIVSSDKDLMQLVDERISVLRSNKGVDYMMGPQQVKEKLLVAPELIGDYLALVGDSSDNIPGVAGIGPKTAVKLLGTHGSLAGIFKNLAQVTPPGVQKKLTNGHESALLSRKLVALVTDISIALTLEDCRMQDPDQQVLGDIYRKLEFKRQLKELEQSQQLPPELEEELPQLTCNITLAVNSGEDKFRQLERFMADKAQVAVAFPSSSEQADKSYNEAFFLAGESGFYLHIASEDELLTLYGLLIKTDTSLLLQAAKRDLLRPMARRGLDITAVKFDDLTLLAYLLAPGERNYDLDRLRGIYLEPQAAKELVAIAGVDAMVLSLAQDARAMNQLYPVFSGQIDYRDQQSLYRDLELKLVYTLAQMEASGVYVDPVRLRKLKEEFGQELWRISQSIKELVGDQVNINSPKQLAQVLFTDLGLPVLKKTKSGPSTAEDVLRKLEEMHPLPGLILEYRKRNKLLSTYIDPLSGFIDPQSQRVHAVFNQMVTATGRLSSSHPNMQNIPVRSEMGRHIRGLFTAEGPDKLLLAADYSQIELRILAHLSGDLCLTKAFKEHQDIHTLVAAEIFMVAPDDVSMEMRRTAKMVNFGIIYGKGSFSLAEELGITRRTAQDFIERYFERYSSVREFIDQTVESAKDQGYISTMMQRRRYLPDVRSRNRNIAAAGARTAINSVIQGSAADLLKLAMLAAVKALPQAECPMVLSVHDELVFEVTAAKAEPFAAVVRQTMEGCMSLSVPLVVNIGTAYSFDLCKT